MRARILWYRTVVVLRARGVERTVERDRRLMVVVGTSQCRTRGGSFRMMDNCLNPGNSWVEGGGFEQGEGAVFRWIWGLLSECERGMVMVMDGIRIGF
jgi:hypothetical protein